MAMLRFILTGAALLTVAGAGRLLAADEAPIEVSAQGESELSYDAAEQDALRTAVRQAVGVALESQTKVVDFTLIRDAMITRANGSPDSVHTS